MIVLGIVGSPAGGKSTAARYLASLGAEWINADLIARDCLAHEDIKTALVERFGTDILDKSDQVNRAKIADLVFGNDAEKRSNLAYLESLVHPRTRAEIYRRIVDAAAGGCPVGLLDVPLLFESRWDRACDEIWCIDASREVRLRRCQDRGWDASELDRRESNQLSIMRKSRLSHCVMRNDATLDALHEILRFRWESLARMDEHFSSGGVQAAEGHCVSDHPNK